MGLQVWVQPPAPVRISLELRAVYGKHRQKPESDFKAYSPGFSHMIPPELPGLALSKR